MHPAHHPYYQGLIAGTSVRRCMSRGTLIAESLKLGCSLEGLALTLSKITREVASDASGNQPSIWTVIEFETSERPERLANA